MQTKVGPRDGLQSYPMIPTSSKLSYINTLVSSGLRRLEVASFVSPKWVPSMANSGEVMDALDAKDGVRYEALTPNMKGYSQAVSHKSIGAVSVFGSSSEAFSMDNINCTIEQSMERFKDVVHSAKRDGVPVRGYISCVWGCPKQGLVPVKDVVRAMSMMKEMGVGELSLGDTIGLATPSDVRSLLSSLGSAGFDVSRDVAVHFHDTRGMAIANILASLDMGVRIIDSSAGGIGGCPYAGKGASGNVATEEVIYLLNGMGVETGVDIDKVVSAAGEILSILGKPAGDGGKLFKAHKNKVLKK